MAALTVADNATEQEKAVALREKHQRGAHVLPRVGHRALGHVGLQHGRAGVHGDVEHHGDAGARRERVRRDGRRHRRRVHAVRAAGDERYGRAHGQPQRGSARRGQTAHRRRRGVEARRGAGPRGAVGDVDVHARLDRGAECARGARRARAGGVERVERRAVGAAGQREHRGRRRGRVGRAAELAVLTVPA